MENAQNDLGDIPKVLVTLWTTFFKNLLPVICKMFIGI